MPLQKIKLKLLGLIAILVVAFFVTAATGWLREKHEVQVKREKYKIIETAYKEKMERIGEGVPLDVFHQIFPDAYLDPTRGGWSISIPTGYSENPSCTNILYRSQGFELKDGIVRPTWIGSGGKHMDRFGRNDLWYYFMRAWRSSLDSEE